MMTRCLAGEIWRCPAAAGAGGGPNDWISPSVAA